VQVSKGVLIEMAERPITVTCYSGHTYAERPLSLVWEGAEHRVKEVIKEWQEPGARLFQIQTEDGRMFVLSYNERGDEWSAFETVK
jgi:hypothetical protein